MRFPGYKEEWKEDKLGNLMDFKVTNSFSRENLNYEKGTVKNIHYGDIHTKFETLFDITKENVPFINESASIGRIVEDNYCKEGDVVFADASEDLNDVGKSIEIINLNNEKLLSGLHTLLARPKNATFHIGFSGYLFKSKNVRTQIQKEAQGTKVLSLSTPRVSKISLTYPTISEQAKVCSIMTAIDKRILTQNKIIEQLETLIKGLREKMLKRQIRFKAKDGNNFPDWHQVPIKNILTIGSGKDYKHLQAGDIPVFGTGGLMTKVDSFLYDGETVCIGRKGTIDNPMYHSGKIWTVDTLFYTHSFKNCLPKFIYYIFQSINWLGYNEASGVPSLSKSTIENIEVNIPSLPEQVLIANFLSSIDCKIDSEMRIRDQCERLKKHLLANLFI